MGLKLLNGKRRELKKGLVESTKYDANLLNWDDDEEGNADKKKVKSHSEEKRQEVVKDDDDDDSGDFIRVKSNDKLEEYFGDDELDDGEMLLKDSVGKKEIYDKSRGFDKYGVEEVFDPEEYYDNLDTGSEDEEEFETPNFELLRLNDNLKPKRKRKASEVGNSIMDEYYYKKKR